MTESSMLLFLPDLDSQFTVCLLQPVSQRDEATLTAIMRVRTHSISVASGATPKVS